MQAVVGILLAGLVVSQASIAASTSDVKYVSESAQGLMSEVTLGTLAQDHAGDPRVKDFGRQMVNDHGKDLERLKALAMKMNTELPRTTNRDQQKESDKLGKMSGKAFDQEYVKYEVKDHRDDIKKQNKELKKTTDPDLRQFAEAELATVTAHKHAVDSLQDRIK